MEPETDVQILTTATLENLQDLWEVERGLRPPDEARSITVNDAVVGTGATLLSVPTAVIGRLGLSQVGTRRVLLGKVPAEAALYEPVRLTIRGRSCTIDVLEVPDDVPILIGKIPLEQLDFIIDLQGRSLNANPAHGGECIYAI